MRLRALLLTLALLVLGPVAASAQQGVFISQAGGCTGDTRLTSPITGRTFCFDQVTNTLYKWTGSVWAQIAATAIPVPASQGGTGLDTSASTGFPSVTAGTWSVGSLIPPATGSGKGLYEAANCSVIGSPVTSQTWCLNTTLGILSAYDGTGFQSDVALATKAIYVIDPRWGAKCDNATDDSTAIQNAINAADRATSADGKSHWVVFPPSTCRVLTGLTTSNDPPPMMGTYGSSGTGTIIDYRGPGAALTIGTSGNANGWRIQNLRISLVNNTNTGSRGIVAAFGCVSCVFDNVEVQACCNGSAVSTRSDYGIYLVGKVAGVAYNVTANVFLNVTVSDADILMRLGDDISNGEGAMNTVTGGTWLRARTYGIEATGESNVFQGNDVSLATGSTGACFHFLGTYGYEQSVSGWTCDGPAGAAAFLFDTASSAGFVAHIGPGRIITPTTFVNDTTTPTIQRWTSSGRSNNTGLLEAGQLKINSKTFLLADNADEVTQRNGANGQTYRLYNTYTSTTNYEDGRLSWSANQLNLQTGAGGGGGTARPIGIFPGGSNGWIYATTGGLYYTTATGGDPGAGKINIGTADGYLVNNVALKNIAETLSNKTLAAPTVSGSATFTGGDAFILANAQTTARAYAQINNTTGKLILGVDSSAGGALLSGSTAYATILASYTATPIQFGAGTGQAVQWTMNTDGSLQSKGVAFASLPASANGSMIYCTDCNATCAAGASTGRWCNRENGAWVGF